jgi:hypothetical protein
MASNIYPLHEESSLVLTVRGRIGLATTVETVVLYMGGDVSRTNERPSVRHVGLIHERKHNLITFLQSLSSSTSGELSNERAGLSSEVRQEVAKDY